ncbi:DNA-binding transcriptional response regulator, NtrC family, contains REC, AAA-type ATPase, and a Fis-type DNA-binding domains [Anaerovirgula multivorans]|uniref:Stage 0 sporulation protein A homolog n=1 Tax=Anaerovirgula multivorans TaxID=312168 RepID=A0A239FIJ0_9FIRM|nr:sigma-54 dependent transcriptional regulator [Anaerovirgula multivorans]SNS56012.1 DNA-binding transcriptional response regulator, NtrC family, contains REC, AAA-type ATPase, and a Fis-type DNA-binding domains [Anaerovirgula multivorans]
MKILVIDDEKSIRLSLKIGLEKLGIKVITAETGEEGLKMLSLENPEMVILDIKLPGIDGIEVLKHMKRIKPSCIIIMITYLSEVKLAVKAIKMGAYDYFTKPFSISDIQNSIEKTKEYIKMKNQLESINPYGKMVLIGNSQGIKKITEIVIEIGRTEHDTCILLEGESGTGKEVIARLIHDKKSDGKKVFMAINCAAIPKTLQESELFGHEKGAFSEAKNMKQGLIERANGGILFLDEIADMDIELQAKMLRVLQEKKFRRIGGLKEIEFNATIVAATNKDLQEEIKYGNFRQDLYYRLNIIPIHIPSLRQRREDIPLLINYFMNEYNEKLNKSVYSISGEAVQMLQKYDWPGNVRELKNIVERIMFFKQGNEIQLEDLPKEILFAAPSQYEAMEHSNLEMVEAETIYKSLITNKWNISKTANELGIARLTLRRKIKKYSLK